MSFLRPDATALVARWWGAGFSIAVALIGVYWGLTAFGFVRWLGWALVPLGLVAAIAAAQKARFGAGGGGAGVVSVDEGRISYFGPTDGGVVALDDITRLSLDRRGVPHTWRIDRPGQPALTIPNDAEGAGALFDAFVTLPGLSIETLLVARRGAPSTAPGQIHVIWQRAPTAIRPLALH